MKFDWINKTDKNRLKLFSKFKERCIPEVNETFEYYNFMKHDQMAGDSTITYMTVVMKLASTYNFGNQRD